MKGKKCTRKRHYTPAELCLMVKQTKIADNCSLAAPYTSISVLYNYLLMTICNWDQEQLAEYNSLINKRDAQIDKKPELVDNYSKYLLRKLGWNTYYEPYDVEKECQGMKGFVKDMQRRLTESDNRILMQATKYSTVHYYTMLEKGITIDKINEIKEKAIYYSTNGYIENKELIMEMHSKLVDEVGIFIELPSVE